MADSFRYDAFISYRHCQPDTLWADWLVGAIETYTPPRSLRKMLEAQKRPARVARVFRDQDETSAGGDLSRQLKDALEQSRALIVVCTRNTPASPWVNQEVEFFESIGRASRVLPLLVEGEPGEAFPRALLDSAEAGARIATPAGADARDVEPLAADVRPSAGRSPRDVKRRALLKLVAGVLDVKYDDLYQRDLRRRRMRAATATALAAVVTVASLAWFGWTRTDRYQVNAVLRDGPPLVVDAVEDDAAAWVQALGYSGLVDEAVRAAEATSTFGGGQVKVMLALAQVLAEQGDAAKAQAVSRDAIARIDGFKPPFRAELSDYAAGRLAAGGSRDEAVALAASALRGTSAITDVAERVTAAERLARRLVAWNRAEAADSFDAVAAALLRMEAARAAKRAGQSERASNLVRESLDHAQTIEVGGLRAYVAAYLADAAATDGLPLPSTLLRDVVTAATNVNAAVARSQAVRMAVRALVRAGNLDTARLLLREISIQEDRDAAVEALIGGYARYGRASDVGALLQESAGRNDLDIYVLLSAAAEGAADGDQLAMLPLLDEYASAEQRVEMRVIVAERLRAMGRDNRETLTLAMRAALAADDDTDTSEPLSRIVTELAATGRVAEARTVLERVADAHSRAFAFIALADEALGRKANAEAAVRLDEAEAAEREVADQDLVAAGLREIGKRFRDAGRMDRARALFIEASERAATLGEGGSSTVADVLVELAHQGEWRLARVTADRACTAADRLRVYAAILSPLARGLEEE
jgi:MTH538 TIR-like domain (DUF1863)